MSRVLKETPEQKVRVQDSQVEDNAEAQEDQGRGKSGGKVGGSQWRPEAGVTQTSSMLVPVRTCILFPGA